MAQLLGKHGGRDAHAALTGGQPQPTGDPAKRRMVNEAKRIRFL